MPYFLSLNFYHLGNGENRSEDSGAAGQTYEGGQNNPTVLMIGVRKFDNIQFPEFWEFGGLIYCRIWNFLPYLDPHFLYCKNIINQSLESKKFFLSLYAVNFSAKYRYVMKKFHHMF